MDPTALTIEELEAELARRKEIARNDERRRQELLTDAVFALLASPRFSDAVTLSIRKHLGASDFTLFKERNWEESFKVEISVVYTGSQDRT